MTRYRARLRTGLLAALAAGMSVLFAVAIPTAPVSNVTPIGSTALDALLHGGDVTGPVWPGAIGQTETARIAAADAPAAAMLTSALTVSGVGALAKLKVTVSQTKNLVNQAIDVSWTGGTPTEGTPDFAANYLQIMQCWGDTSPDRTQCQFGGKAAFDTRGGGNSSSRKLNQLYLDPKEPLTTDLPAQTDAYVPFKPAVGKLVTGIDTLKNPYYDQSTTNELPFAATRGDGRGFETFEAQTSREAPGLGCGDVVKSGPKKGQLRGCWLVIVPRAGTEVDGTGWDVVKNQGSHRLDSSPLSQTNWASRLVIPLTFAAVGQVCPISAKQRPLAGAEPIAEAVLRWQPSLCKNNGPVFGYTQLADAVAERKVLGSSPGISLLSSPIAASRVPADRRLVYAPLSVSGITFALMMERQSAPDAAPELRSQDGERITELNLTPRLVAKLLTQSYTLDVAPNARYLKTNPTNITKDPDFLAINPKFKDLTFRDSVETLMPIGLSDANATVWRWLAADQDALDFLAGLPDRWGMRINPFYQGVSATQDTFTKVDPYCDVPVSGASPLCTLDRHPYAQDFHDTARSTSRGDPLSRNNWDPNSNPPAYKKAAPQLNGLRHILAVTDSASASRFGLITAKLRNGAGKFVGPTQSGLSAGLAAMRSTGSTGVLVADPESASKTAYPLTTVTYGVTAPNILTKDAAKDYALFIRYAAAGGQKRGTDLGNLPDGYLPLTSTLRKRARAVAQDVESRRGPPRTPDSDDPSDSDPGDSGGSDGGSGGGGGGVGGSTPIIDSPTTGIPETTATTAPPQALPITTIGSSAPKLFTPGDVKSAARFALLIALTLGSSALIFGLLLPRLARRLGQ